ncbi:MAG: hypothetical protein HY673_08925 [Chloroflexi bacterium]|nr:hypothetical protein [Chloroflexota bacterium]
MQQWEYLVVRLWNEHWGDSEGRTGKMPTCKQSGGVDWYNSGPLLVTLGGQGWELVSTTSYGGTKLFFKRPKQA